jgi:hypothetical protein
VVGMVAVQPGVPRLAVLYKQLCEIGHGAALERCREHSQAASTQPTPWAP